MSSNQHGGSAKGVSKGSSLGQSRKGQSSAVEEQKDQDLTMSETKINPIPKKSTDSVGDYLAYFERVKVANNWSDEEAAVVFPACLEVGTKALQGLSSTTLSKFSLIKNELAPAEESYREASVQEFFSLTKKDNESCEDFQRRVKQCVEQCYGSFAQANRQQLARDAFVHGLPYSLKQAVLNLKSVKLADAVGAAKMSEAAQETFKKNVSRSFSSGTQKKKQDLSNIQCYKCGVKGHFATKCQPKFGAKDDGQKKSQIRHREDIAVVDVASSGRPTVKVHVNGHRENCLIDTGADASVLPMSRFKAERTSTVQLCTASGDSLSTSGTRECIVDVGSFQVSHNFYVAAVKKPILGVDFLKQHKVELNVKPNGEARLSFTGEGRSVKKKVICKSHPIEVVDQEDQLAEVVSEDEEVHVIASVLKREKEDPNYAKGIELVKTEFPEVIKGIGRTHFIEHEIQTSNASPICSTPFRLPFNLIPKARDEIKKLKEQGIVVPSTSEWCNPLVLVKKKTGNIRVAVDFRKINAVSKKDAFPMPRVDEVLDSLAGSRIFSTLDCASGYYQIPLKKTDSEKTAFRFDGELLEFTVMPFGLSSAPQTFVRLMKKVLRRCAFRSVLHR